MKYQIIPPQQLRLAIKLIRKNLFFLILIPLFAAFVGFYKAYRIPNVYKAQAQYLYKGDEPSMLGAMGGQRSFYRNDSKDAENQRRILKSYDLIGDVIDKLDFEVTYYLKGRIRKTVQYPTANAFKIEVDSVAPDFYGRPLGIFFGPENIEISYFEEGEEIVDFHPYESKINSNKYAFEFVLPGNDDISSFINWPSQYEIIINSRNQLINKFRGSLRVDVSDQSSVISVSITDQSVYKSIDFLDTLTLVYSNFSTREKRLKNERSLDFIENQISVVTKSINLGEEEMGGVKESNSIINLSAEQARYNQKVMEYEEQLLALDVNRTKLGTLKDYLEGSNELTSMPPSTYIPENDAFLQQTVSDYFIGIRERESTLYDATPNNPRSIRTKEALSKLKADMIDYIEKSISAISQRKSQIYRLKAKYEGNLKALPQSQREILNIERRIAVNEKLYNYLLEQRATKIIEGASIAPEFEILDTARSYGFVGPMRQKMVMNHTMYGLVIVLLIAGIRFLFFDSIESLKELQDNTQKKVVAGIPKLKNILQIGDPEYMNSDQAYALRKLRTSIQYLATSINKEGKTILVTSMFPSEGKTFVSSSIGNLNSLSGKKVVIVDFDLHKPNLHKQFGLDKNIAGLSMVLTGHATYEESYQEVSPNLHILTSGPLPPNPSELILRQATTDLVNHLKANYDVVIFDTPPVSPVTDAKMLVKFAEINLVVMNGKYATRRNLGAIEELIEEIGVENSGIVFNAIKTPTLMAIYGKYAYKYGYTYGYNYGYGYEYTYRYGKSRN